MNKLHLYRYGGGRTMCGRPEVETDWTDSQIEFDASDRLDSRRQCATCRRAAAVDDAREMVRQRAVEDGTPKDDDYAPDNYVQCHVVGAEGRCPLPLGHAAHRVAPSIGEIAETSGGWEAQNEAHRRAVEPIDLHPELADLRARARLRATLGPCASNADGHVWDFAGPVEARDTCLGCGARRPR